MSFLDMVSADIDRVFLNDMEFAEQRTLRYDGEVYENIKVVLSKYTEQSRPQHRDDHAEGLFAVRYTLHCNYDDLGTQPEKGGRIFLNDCTGGLFFQPYYIAESSVEMGMVRLILEAICE